MTDIAICDVPNTLFDSRYRSTGCYTAITGIEQDKPNLAAFLLLHKLHLMGYTIILTHYCLTRVVDKVEQKIQKHASFPYKLINNFPIPAVHSNKTLKQYILQNYTDIFHTYTEPFVIDNDPSMTAYYLNHKVMHIQVPLQMQLDNTLKNSNELFSK